MLETSEATADARHLKGELGMDHGIGDEAIDEATDDIERQRATDAMLLVAQLGGQSIAVAVVANALAPASTLLLVSMACSTTTVVAACITSETRRPFCSSEQS